MALKQKRFKTAFILGAGLGTRLRPLTENCPKPLLDIGGRPVISYVMDHLLTAGVDRFIVNTHHCPEAYRDRFPDGHWRGAQVLFRYEPILMDTAGGLKNVEDLLGNDDAIICYNGDVLADFPLQPLLDFHAGLRPEAALCLRSTGPVLNVNIDANGSVCDLRHRLGKPGVQSCLFSGIYTIETSILQHFIEGKIESVIDVFTRRIIEQPGSVAGLVIDEGRWHDIGSVGEYGKLADGWQNPSIRS